MLKKKRMKEGRRKKVAALVIDMNDLHVKRNEKKTHRSMLE